MPTAALNLKPGVDVQRTPVLNQAGFSTSQLIRFREGLVEKMGGWTSFYNGTPGGNLPVFDLWAWQGLNNDTYLAAGTSGGLGVLANGTLYDVAPYTLTLQNGATNSLTTTNLSTTVTVTDTGSSTAVGDTVNFVTPISVANLLIQGPYSVATVTNANTYTIVSAVAATSGATGGVPPSYVTTAGSRLVTVTLANHGLAINSTFYVTVPTTVGGVILSGPYTVATVTSSSVFTIFAASTASGSATLFQGGANNLYNTYYYTNSVGRTLSGTPVTTSDWTFDNYGAYLVACAPGGPIYVWNPYVGTQGLRAQIISAAPVSNDGIIVSSSAQQIVAWGSTVGAQGDPLLIRWSDAGNYNTWTPTVTNLAGSLRVPSGSKIVAMAHTATGFLVFTDVDLWLMNYVGSTSAVYGLQKISENCGLLSRHALNTVGSTCYWASTSAFFMYSPSTGVQPLASTVYDRVFQNLKAGATMYCGTNVAFNEVMWLYPSSVAATAIAYDSYAKFNFVEGAWDYGTLNRTAWIDLPLVATGPISGDTTGALWAQEKGFDNGAAAMTPSFTTGYFAVSEGEEIPFIDRIIPDFRFQRISGQASTATLSLTISAQTYPDGAVTAYGPYTITAATQWIDVRIRGRLLSFSVSSSDSGTWWRLGNLRYRFATTGRNG